MRCSVPSAAGADLRPVPRIGYDDFLAVHRILFGGLYPWAGTDRVELIPDKAITKGDVLFATRATAVGDRDLARAGARPDGRPARLIMGLFAYGHPFLDGNGRTMLLVHAELCRRAGMSVDWTRTRGRLPARF